MSVDLRELYQTMITDHARHPRNFRVIEQASHHAEGFNPLCGDRLCLYIHLEQDRIKDASFQGEGCAISTASASLMLESLLGKTEKKAQELFHTFQNILTQKEEPTHDQINALGKLAVFLGVRAYPIRIKCATLAWHALRCALKNNKY